ncbi:MAG: hypothetical protein ACKVXR_13060 [Planctomycetota bacterium]
MSLAKTSFTFAASRLAFVLLLVLAGCSGGSSGSSNSIGTAVQDLTGDPEGTTTVITFASTKGLAAATTAAFEATGGQTAQSVTVVGNVVTVTWNGRVTPTHQVRATGLSGVTSAFHAVTTSDPSVPTYTIQSATQNPGWGGDTVTITFSGPHIVETEAEDETKWTLMTGGVPRDLSGSTFDFDTATQELDIVLGTDANLHATFTFAVTNLHSVADVQLAATPVAGNATGDATPPNLVSAHQNLTEDEFGRVIDFTFDEAMDPDLSVLLSHFSVTLPDVATTVEQPSEDMLRVTFNNPIVPGYDTVTLQGLVDLHGNAFPDGIQAIVQPSPVANAFAGNVQALTVANAGGDYVRATTTQAFDPDSALDPTLWSLDVAGAPIDLTTQTLSYDLLTKTLTIDLTFDMDNGDSFTLQSLGVVDVDGDTSSLTQTQSVSGETTAPTVLTARQNRTIDSAGAVVDVQMSEDVDVVTAQTLANWTASGGQSLLTASLLPGLDQVRLTFNNPMIPGDVTITAQNVRDLADNPMVLQAGISLTSTDTTPPAATTWSATAHQGENNDVIEVFFDDEMVPTDVTDVSRWSLESPVFVARSTVGATVEYEPVLHRARLKLVNGVNLRRDEDFQVVLTGVRDVGGNALPTTPISGDVSAESTLPYVHTIWRPALNPDQVEVRFSEPCDFLDDIYVALTNPAGTRYILRDSGGVLRGYATSATSLDSGLGARVSFGIVVDPSDTIDVLGATDLVGNPLFPALAFATVAEDTAEPTLALGVSFLTTISGEENDVLSVTFDRPVSPYTVTDHTHYTVTGATNVEKRGFDVQFNGVDTVTLPLRSNAGDYDVLTAASYDLTAAGIRTAQGVPMSFPATEVGMVVTGDVSAPTVQVGKVRVDPTTANALLVEFREAMAEPSVTTAANYDYDSGTTPLFAEMLGPRTARLTFASQPAAGFDLAFTVEDKAGNSSGLITRTVAAADAAGPLVVSVAGSIRPGWGGDEILVSFDEPVKPSTALNASNYTVTTGGFPRSLTGASLSYSSVTSLVRIRLAGGQELLAGQPVSVGITSIQDFSGNTMSVGLQVGGSTTGDAASVAFANAFVNRRIDVNGTVVDVLFSEDVNETFVTTTSNWTATGATVLSVEMRERNHALLTLSAALPGAGTLQMTGVPDLAGNVSGNISIDPAE